MKELIRVRVIFLLNYIDRSSLGGVLLELSARIINVIILLKVIFKGFLVF